MMTKKDKVALLEYLSKKYYDFEKNYTLDIIVKDDERLSKLPPCDVISFVMWGEENRAIITFRSMDYNYDKFILTQRVFLTLDELKEEFAAEQGDLVSNKIKTLKDDVYFDRIKNGEKKDIIKCGVVFSQCSNAYQICIPGEDYYVESSSEERGYIPEIDRGGFVFDIASVFDSKTQLRDAILRIAYEKLKNDIYSIDNILKRYYSAMGLEGETINIKDILGILEDNKD